MSGRIERKRPPSTCDLPFHQLIPTPASFPNGDSITHTMRLTIEETDGLTSEAQTFQGPIHMSGTFEISHNTGGQAGEGESPALVQFGTRLPPELIRKLKFCAVDRGLSLQECVMEALEQWTERQP